MNFASMPEMGAKKIREYWDIYQCLKRGVSVGPADSWLIQVLFCPTTRIIREAFRNSVFGHSKMSCKVRNLKIISFCEIAVITVAYSFSATNIQQLRSFSGWQESLRWAPVTAHCRQMSVILMQKGIQWKAAISWYQEIESGYQSICDRGLQIYTPRPPARRKRLSRTKGS